MILIAFYGLSFSNIAFNCEKEDFVVYSTSEYEPEFSTFEKLEKVRTWIIQLTQESKTEGLSPVVKAENYAKIHNLKSILVAIEKDQSDAGLR